MTTDETIHGRNTRLGGLTRTIPFLMPVALLATAGCIEIGQIEGSGTPETVTYDFDSFDEIDIGGAFEAEITITSGEPSVEITVDDNLVDRLEVDLDNGELDIGFRSGNYDFETTPTAIITLPELTDLEVSGASDVEVDGLAASEFDLEVSGASEVRIDGTVTSELRVDGSGASNIVFRGSADDLVLDLSGASNAELDGLTLDAASIDVSGASDVELGDVATVSGDLSGASSLTVDPDTSVSVDTSGASEVERR